MNTDRGTSVRIALDASNLALEEPTGVAVYGINLINHIAALDLENQYCLCCRLSRWKDRRYFFELAPENFQTKIIQEPLNFRFTRKIDLFHGLDARIYDSKRVKNVVTIHDMLQYTNEFPATRHPEKKIRRYERVLTKADRIIAVSGHTKREILRYFPVDPEKIDIVHHGVEERFQPKDPEATRNALQKYEIRLPYLLYVGTFENRKNLPRVLEAFSRVENEYPKSVQLVLVGSSRLRGEEAREKLRTVALGENVRAVGYVSRTDLPFLYSGALAFLFPTLYEGFGLPVLEAMACGAAVITSNVTSLPEIAGDAALLVDPFDVDSIAQAILQLLEDPELRTEYVRRGFRRAGEFSWERSARETLAVYRKTLKSASCSIGSSRSQE